MKEDKLVRFFGDRFHKNVFLMCLIVALGLIITSFFIPPLAVVDGSVLAAVGEIFAFAALGEVAAAIERGHSASITHGNTTIEIKKEEEEDVEDRPESEIER
jgi:formate hydrogenlyase subunit 4